MGQLPLVAENMANVFGVAESYRTELKGKFGWSLHGLCGWELGVPQAVSVI